MNTARAHTSHTPHTPHTPHTLPTTHFTCTKVLELADTMAQQLLSCGYEYLVLDGGWSATTTILPNGTKWGHPVLDE